MLAALAKSVRDTSILQRLLFAWSNLPKDLPDAIEFTTLYQKQRWLYD